MRKQKEKRGKNSSLGERRKRKEEERELALKIEYPHRANILKSRVSEKERHRGQEEREGQKRRV